jgi:hypothetical protein
MNYKLLKPVLATTFFGFLLFSGYAQPAPAKEKRLNSEEESKMEKAQLMLEEKNYRMALPVFEGLLENHPGDNRLKYFTALCYVSRPDKHPQMLQYLTDVYAANKKVDRAEFYLAKANFLNYKFDEASKFLDQHIAKQKKQSDQEKKEVEQLGNYIQNAKKLAENPLAVKIENLGPTVNTAASENSPYVTMNDSFMIITYRGEQSTGGMQNAYNEEVKNGLYYEDVFMSTKENDAWTKPRGISAVNTNNNDEALSVSYDGKQLFISRDSEVDDGDIYMSTFNGQEWSVATKLVGDVNSPHWEDNCCLSPDGKTLFFSSSRPGGYGGKDIYKSNLQADGTWGLAQNLGDKINTKEDEDDPFFHLDGKLLLFSSKGHNSMGGYDIFKAYLNPTDSSWSVPENIGYPINTPDDDVHYVLSPAGDKAYFAIAKAGGQGDYDIYTVEPGITGIMPAMLVVKGSVTQDNNPVQADITVSVNNSVYKKYRSNAATGFYQVVLPLGQDYKINWQLNDSVKQSQTVEAAKANAYLLKINDVNFSTKKDTALASGNATPDGGETIEGVLFKIQIAAESLNRKLDKKKIAGYGKIEKKVVDKIARFTLDKEYKTLADANTILEQLRGGLVPDAFVICTYKDKRYYVYELRKMGVIK